MVADLNNIVDDENCGKTLYDIILCCDDKGRTATPVEDEVKASTPHSIDNNKSIIIVPSIANILLQMHYFTIVRLPPIGY